jgi:hypothetical protein
MRFRQNKVSYKYKPEFYKREDELKVKNPSYSVYRYGAIKQNGIWNECRFYVFKKSNETILEISPTGIIKDGISNLGPINEQMYFNRVKLSWFNRLLIFTYDKLFFLKISFLKFLDRIKPIKSNLSYILLAFLGSAIYFLVNHYFDNYLQKLINNSNLAQSVIVFLSLSSIINIFHPFTLRKELNINEVDELIKKKSEKMKEDLEHEEWARKNASF